MFNWEINKLVFLVVLFDHWYKLDYVSFCFIVHNDTMIKVLVDGIEAYLMCLYNCYRSQVDGFHNDLSAQGVICE